MSHLRNSESCLHESEQQPIRRCRCTVTQLFFVWCEQEGGGLDTNFQLHGPFASSVNLGLQSSGAVFLSHDCPMLFSQSHNFSSTKKGAKVASVQSESCRSREVFCTFIPKRSAYYSGPVGLSCSWF